MRSTLHFLFLDFGWCDDIVPWLLPLAYSVLITHARISNHELQTLCKKLCSNNTIICHYHIDGPVVLSIGLQYDTCYP